MLLISLAIGTLIGTSFFHLIPQVRFIFSVKLSHLNFCSFKIELNRNRQSNFRYWCVNVNFSCHFVSSVIVIDFWFIINVNLIVAGRVAVIVGHYPGNSPKWHGTVRMVTFTHQEWNFYCTSSLDSTETK
jgi:hypothetical protein